MTIRMTYQARAYASEDLAVQVAGSATLPVNHRIGNSSQQVAESLAGVYSRSFTAPATFDLSALSYPSLVNPVDLLTNQRLVLFVIENTDASGTLVYQWAAAGSVPISQGFGEILPGGIAYFSTIGTGNGLFSTPPVELVTSNTTDANLLLATESTV